MAMPVFWTEEKLEEVKKYLYETDMAVIDIARKLKVQSEVLKNIMSHRGIKIPKHKWDRGKKLCG